MRSSRFKIKEYIEGKKRGYLVYGYKKKDLKGNRKRVRKKFPDKEQALDYRHMLELKEKQENENYKIRKSRISDEDEHLVLSLVEEIKEQVKSDKVLLGLSGGVDSSVTAALLHKAIGKKYFI